MGDNDQVPYQWSSIDCNDLLVQGASLFGDGFSVFFTQDSNHKSVCYEWITDLKGKMFGTSDLFYGFAIVFSTFKNTEVHVVTRTNSQFARYHRDIALYVGDGKTGAYIQDQDHAGCYSRYRFHEKRQDFSVYFYCILHSRLTIMLL